MLSYIVRRLLAMVPFVLLTSVTVFILIQLPPGDYISNYAAQLAESQETVDDAALKNLRERFGLGEPLHVQYWKWISGVVTGDLGWSFEWQQPVGPLIGERMLLTVLLAIGTLLLTWGLALPIGIYSAVRKNSLGDYLATFVGFIGLATPSFLLALGVMYLGATHFGQSVGGLFSPEYGDRALEPGQDGRPALAPVGADADHRPVGHGQPDPRDARQPAGRAEQAVRGDGPRQGPGRVHAADALPGAHGAEPLRQHHRLDPAAGGVGLGHRGRGAEPADRRADAAAEPAVAGHVPGRRLPDPAVLPDRDRDADLRSAAGADRPAHPSVREAAS